MLEYIFFHEKPFKLFVEFIKQLGLTPITVAEDDSFTLQIPEDTEDALVDRIEDRYDELFDMNRELFDEAQQEDANHYDGASVVVNLSDGNFSYADIDPALLNKVLQVISPEEFGGIVAAIADAVENPQNKSYCQRLRDKT